MPLMRVLLVMGPAGAGKTTIARRLARVLDFDFIEGDAFHSPSNVAKMTAGRPLDDADRAPWLTAVRQALEDGLAIGRSAVVACSGLRRAYREFLLGGLPHVAAVYLEGPPDLLRERIAQRPGHYMPAGLLDSQLAALEPPARMAAGEPLVFGPWRDRALFVDAGAPVETIVSEVTGRLAPSGEGKS